MQGDGGVSTAAGAVAEEEPSLIQPTGVSRGEELPLLPSLALGLCGESHTYTREENQTSTHPPPDLQDTSTTSDGGEGAISDTPSLSGDLKCITLSSTPFRKVSTPRDIGLDTETADDWSVSMATPTSLQHLPIGSTPIVTTTDEEPSDLEKSSTCPVRVPCVRQPVDKTVIRTLFSAAGPTSSSSSPPLSAPDRHTAATVRRLHGNVDTVDFSPIQASPLLTSTQPTTADGDAHNTSTSLISTHTVAETPTRPPRKRESVGLNKGFCDESGGALMACSQELFESPDVFDGDDTVGPVTSVPDSPPAEESTLIEEDKEPHSLTDGVELMKREEEEEEPAPCTQNLTTDIVPQSTAAGNRSSPPQVRHKSCEQVRSANYFHYPSSRQSSNTLQPTTTTTTSEECRTGPNGLQSSPSSSSSSQELKEVQCEAVEPRWRPRLRRKRKRTMSSLAAPPVKKASLACSVSDEDGVSGSVAKSVSDSVLLTPDGPKPVAVVEQCTGRTAARLLPGVRSDYTPEPNRVADKRETPSPALAAEEAVVTRASERETEKMAEPAHTETVVPSFTGFKTASGRSLSISETSLQNARKFLTEDTDQQNHNTILSNEASSRAPTTHVTAPINTGGVTPRPPLTVGATRTRVRVRQTRSFKAPRLASSVNREEETVRVAQLLQTMRKAGAGGSAAPVVATSTPQLMESGFSTGSGRTLSISTSAFQRAQRLVTEDKENGITAASKPSAVAAMPVSCGFQSASGKRVRVSAESLERAHSLVADTGQGISSKPSAKLGCGTPHTDPGKPSEVQPPVTFYTGGELGTGDLIDFAVFTQFAEAVGDCGRAVTAVESGEGEMEDCSACFSTQVVKQFLNFSAEEEEEEEESMSSHTASVPCPATATTPPSTTPTAPPTESENCQSQLSQRDTVQRRTECWQDTVQQDTVQQDTVQQGTQEGSKLVEACCDQSSLMDELFGAATSNPEPRTESTLGDHAGSVAGVGSGMDDDGTVEEEEVMEQEETSDGLEKTDSEGEMGGEERGEMGGEERGEMGGGERGEMGGGERGEMEGGERGEMEGGERGEMEGEERGEMEGGERGEMEGACVCNDREKDDVGDEEDISKHLVEETSRPQDRSWEGTSSFPGLMTASGRKIGISSDALSAARAVLNSTQQPPSLKQAQQQLQAVQTQQQQRQQVITSQQGEVISQQQQQQVITSQHSRFPGLQTAGGREVHISQAALEAVRQQDLTTPSPALPSPHPRPDTEQRRTVPLFRPLTVQRPSPSSSGGSVRYKPVFRCGQQTASLQRQTHLPPPPHPLRDRHSGAHALHSAPEGVLSDRAPSRRPLTPMQTFLGSDGSYISTPVQRYNFRSRSSSTASCTHITGREREEGREVSEEEGKEVSREEGREVSGDSGEGGGVVSSTDARQSERCGTEDQPSHGSGLSTECSRERETDMDQVERETDMDQVERGGEGEGEGVSGGGVSAVNQLDDSLEEEEEEEEGVADEPSIPPPSLQFRRHSVRKSSRKREIPRSAGTLWTVRLTQCEEREALMDLPGCRCPGRYSPRQLLEAGVHTATLTVTASNAAAFQFRGDLFFSLAVLDGAPVCVGDGAMLRLSEGQAGVRELWEAFANSPGVDKKLVSFEWFSNHYRWTVWKLAAVEVAFPSQCAGRYLTPDWLMKQLRYRYDREIEAAERPALRRICEHDDVSQRRLVLCVSVVYPNPPPDPTGEKREEEAPTIEVTDGWYSLPALLDPPLRYMVRSGCISVGTKIMTSGAELVGPRDPCHPLDVPSDLCLGLSANSTRRARWFTGLGYQLSPHPFCLPLSSLFPDGGVVGCTQAVITRVYPFVYMEKMEDGSRSVFRNGRAEERAMRYRQEQRQQAIETVSCRVQREFEEEIARREQRNGTWRRSRRLNTLQVRQLQDGGAIHTAITNSPDPQALQEALSSMQLALLESYRHSLVVSQQGELQCRIQQAVEREEREGRLPHSHTTTPLLRVRLVPPGTSSTHVDYQLSLWRPSEEVRGVLVEGRVVGMWNVNTASGKKSSHFLQLSASQNTRFRLVDMDIVAMETALVGYHPRECVSIGSLVRGEGVWYGEVDTVGVVVCVTSEHAKETRSVDTVFLADSERHVMATTVWDGLEHHALRGLLSPAATVSVTSLTYRGRHSTSGHVLTTAGDHAHFSQAPSEPRTRDGLQQLRAALPKDLHHYLSSLEEDIMENIHLSLHHH